MNAQFTMILQWLLSVVISITLDMILPSLTMVKALKIHAHFDVGSQHVIFDIV